MAYNNRDELLDDFFDHIFGEDEVTDEDEAWFKDKIEAFFDKAEGIKPPGRRRTRGTPPSKPRRRPGSTSKADNDNKGGYGLSALFGGNN